MLIPAIPLLTAVITVELIVIDGEYHGIKGTVITDILNPRGQKIMLMVVNLPEVVAIPGYGSLRALGS